MRTQGAPECLPVRESLSSKNRCLCRGEAESRRQLKRARIKQGSWDLFTGHTWIEPQRRVVAAIFLDDYEYSHRRRTRAQPSQPFKLLKSPHQIGHGDFRETHRGVLGGVFRIISRSSSASSNCSRIQQHATKIYGPDRIHRQPIRRLRVRSAHDAD